MPGVVSPNTVSFGNPAALIAPDVAAQQLQLARQQQLVDLLKQRALTPDEQQTVTGAGPTRVVPYSPLQGLAKMLTGYMAGSSQKDIDEKNLDLSRQYAQRMAQILGGGGGVDPSVAGPMSMAQGAQQQPPTAAPDGSLNNAGGLGPTVQNAQRMDAMTQGQGAQGAQGAQPGNNNFDLAKLLRGSVVEQVGGAPAASAFWKQYEPTDLQRNDSYLGISQAQSRNAELAKRIKEGYIPPTRLGNAGYNDPQRGFIPLPAQAPPGFINIPDPTDPSGYKTVQVGNGTAAVGAAAAAKTGGEGSVLPFAGVDGSGNPLPVTNRTAAATQGAQQPALAAPPGGPMAVPSAMPPGNPPPGAGIVAPQSPVDRMSILQQQLAKTQQGIADPTVNDADRARLQQDATDIQSEMARMSATNGKPNGVAPGAVYAAPPLGQTPYSDKLGTVAADRASATRSLAADSPTRVNVYDNILNLSKSGVNSGPGSAWQNQVKGYVANTPFLSSVTKGWRDDVSGFQELNKFMYQNAQRNWQAAGGTGTDAQLEAFSHSNPNDKMFPQALQAMAQWGKGGELALQGKATAQDAWLQNNGDNPKQQQAFENAWRSNFDPQLFQLRAMDPQAQQAFVANLKKTNPNGYSALMSKAQTLKGMGAL